MDLRRKLISDSLSTSAATQEKPGKIKAFAIFSADALSSLAYASGEMLTVLMMAGASALYYSMPLSIIIALLMLSVGYAYFQAMRAYPQTGNSYVVARENFGLKVAALAAVALMIDFVLTVAVSISAAVLAITSAFPVLGNSASIIAVVLIALLAWLNLRGTRESTTTLALPTYLFIGILALLLGIGLFRHFSFGLSAPDYGTQAAFMTSAGNTVTLLLLLRAFAAGCSALTGIEVIANATQAFRSPRTRNAITTLVVMIIVLVVLFIGIAFLASTLALQPLQHQSLLSQLGHAVFGSGLSYYLLQAATALILLVAANSAFASFPRLVSLISQDGLMPRQFQNIGDRLAFANSIVFLAALAGLLVLLFNARTSTLIPLYSVGVFTAFTLCQAGLVKRCYKRRTTDPGGWRIRLAINATGCLCTFIAAALIIESTFFQGAWLVLLPTPFLYLMFHKIRRHYEETAKQLNLSADEGLLEATMAHYSNPKVIVPVSKLHKGTIAALEFAQNLSQDVVAVAIDTSSEKTRRLKQLWQLLNMHPQLVVLESPYQSVVRPLVQYVKTTDLRDPQRGLAVIVIPKANTTRWWQGLLHNQKTAMLKMAINYMSRNSYRGKTRIIVEVPYQIS